jgi:hypothetical protein
MNFNTGVVLPLCGRLLWRMTWRSLEGCLCWTRSLEVIADPCSAYVLPVKCGVSLNLNHDKTNSALFLLAFHPRLVDFLAA